MTDQIRKRAASDTGTSEASLDAQPRRRTRTREALLSAGRGLMAARSRDGFTIDDIVQKAGVAKGSFYNHFADKQALVDEVCKAIRAKEEEQIAAVNAASAEPAVRIARAMAVYARLALTFPEEARILTSVQVDALSLDSPMNTGLLHDITDGLRTGQLVTPSVEAALLMVVGQTAVLLSRLQTMTRREAASLVQQCIALTLLGLGLEHRTAHLISAQAVEEIVRPDRNGGAEPPGLDTAPPAVPGRRTGHRLR